MHPVDVGCLAHAARFDCRGLKQASPLRLLVLGIAACASSRSSRGATAFVLAAVGLLHVYAYGEAIVGAEPTPLVAYLLGLSLVQLEVASVLMYVARPRDDRATIAPRITLVRVVGVASALVGVVALALEMARLA